MTKGIAKFTLIVIIIGALIIWINANNSERIAPLSFVDQINKLRIDNDIGALEHNELVNNLAKYIHDGNENYEDIFNHMGQLGLDGDGQYFVYWKFNLSSSIANQINELSVGEQHYFVHPDAIFWGYFNDENSLDCMFVLIFKNPLFTQTIGRVKDLD